MSIFHRMVPDPAPETVQWGERFTEALGEPQVRKPRRNRKSARKAGTLFERAVADYLNGYMLAEFGADADPIDRRVRTGAKDKGDILGLKGIRGGKVVAECKNVTRMDLSGWLTEARVEAANDDAPMGVVIHKRHGKGEPADQYVTMDLRTFAHLLAGGSDDLRGAGA